MRQHKEPLLFAVVVQVNPFKRKEFNHWYNTVHVPDMLKCPGWLNGRRFEAVGTEDQFLALYELASEKALETPEFERARGWGPMLPVVKSTKPILYRHLYTAPKGKGASGAEGPFPLIRFNRSEPVPEIEERYNQWYNQVHLPELLDCPHWITAKRYIAIRGEPKYLAMYELSDLKAFETPQYVKVRGFKELQPYVRNLSTITYRQIYPPLKA